MSDSVLKNSKNISLGYAALVVGLVFAFVLGGAIKLGGNIETMFILAWLFTVPLPETVLKNIKNNSKASNINASCLLYFSPIR